MLSIVPVSAGAAHGAVRVWLRLEGIAAFLLATSLYAHHGDSWLMFAALFFVPDVSITAYLAGPRVGAAIYNVVHSYIGPLIVGAVAVSAEAGLTVALVWAAHIGFDRALGYGLKYPTAFGNTHLGRIGRGGGQLDPR